MQSTADALIEAAIEWAEAGVPVFPTGDDKRPLTENGFYDASLDADTITAMFKSAGNRLHGIGGRMGAASTVSITAGEATPVSYSYTTPRGPLAQNYRQPFGRGIKARYFSFGVSGSDVLEIDSIDLDVLTLKRRI